MNSILWREQWLARRVFTRLDTPSWQTRMCLIFPSWRSYNISNHEATWRSFAWRHFYCYPTTRASRTTAPRPCLPLCLQPAWDRQAKARGARDLQDSHKGKPTETPKATEGALCPLVPTRTLGPGAGQQPNSSLEADLVTDVVNHLSKHGAIILCWIFSNLKGYIIF